MAWYVVLVMRILTVSARRGMGHLPWVEPGQVSEVAFTRSETRQFHAL